VRDAEVERAPEIAGEFYPNGDAACSDLAEASIAPNDVDDVIARICELAHRLGYNEAKTKMLLGQWARNLVSLERSMWDELEALPDKPVRVAEDADQKKTCRETKSQAGEIGAPNSSSATLPREEQASCEGFLF
jgi:hypothetical protein